MGIFGDLNLGGENVQGDEELLHSNLPTDENGEVEEFNPDSKVDFGQEALMQDQENFDATVNQTYGESLTPISSQEQGIVEQGEAVDPNLFSANIQEDFGRSLIRGTGTVLGGLGDLFQAGGGAMGSAFGDQSWWKGNSLSDFFHGWGDDIQNANQNYVPDEFKEIKMESLSSIDGWKYLISNEVAETIPYMAEFMLTGFGAGSLAKKGATSLAKKALKKYAKKGILKNTVKGVTRDGVEYGAKRTIPNLLLNEQGLSKTGGAMAHAFGAGAANNQMIAIGQSAEAVNEAKMMKREDGSAVFSDDDLAEIASDTYAWESAYIAADIASWAFTFGKMDKGLLRSIGANKAPSIAKTFGQKALKRIGKTAKVGFKAGVEGAEETIQEVYEEWAKKKSIAEAKMKKGLISQNKYDGIKGFTDFYSSKETEGLRIVAGLTGGLMAGGKTSIDLMAEKSRLLSDLEEILKVKMPKNADGDLQYAQELSKRRVIADIVANDRQHDLNNTLSEWVSNGIMTKEEYDETVNEVNEFAELYQKSSDLSIEGTDQLYYLTSAKNDALKAIEIEGEILKKQYANADSMGLGQEETQVLKDKALATHDEAVATHKAVAEDYAKKTKNMILGKPLEASVDLEGDVIGFRGFSKKDYQKFTNKGKAEKSVSKDAKETATNLKDKAVKATKEGIVKAKDIIKNFNKDLTDEALENRKKKSKIVSDSDISSVESEYGVTVKQNEDGGYDVESDLESDVKPRKRAAIDKISEILSSQDEAYQNSLKERTELETEVEAEVEKDKSGKPISEKFKDVFSKVKEAISSDNDADVESKSDNDSVIDKAKKVDNKVKEAVSDADYDYFIDKGKVAKNILENIASKIKDNNPLSKREQAIHADKTSEIESILKDFISKTKDAVSDKAKDYKEKFDAFVNDDSKPKSRGKKKDSNAKTNVGVGLVDDSDLSSSKGVQGRFKKVSSGEKVEAAGTKVRSEIQKIQDKVKGALSSAEFESVKKEFLEAKNHEDLTSAEINAFKFIGEQLGIQEKISKLKKKLLETKVPKTKREIKNEIRSLKKSLLKKVSVGPKFEVVKETLTEEQKNDLYSIDEIHNLSGQHYDTANYAKMLVVRKNIGKKYPGVNLNMVNDLSTVLGSKSLGYAIGSAIYINTDSVNQPNVIAHEMVHVYYNLTKGTPATKRLVDFLMKNDKLVNDIKSQYWDQVEFSFKNEVNDIDVVTDVRTIMAKNPELSFTNLKDFVEYMSQYGTISELPLENQEVIKEEVFAFHSENAIESEYDKYFNPRLKNKAKFLSKKWWQDVRSKLTLGMVKTDEKQEVIDFLNDLDKDGIPVSERHLKTHMMSEFSKGFSKQEFYTGLRGLRKVDAETAKQVESSMRNQRGVFNIGDKVIGDKKDYTKDFGVIADVYFNEADEVDTYETGSLDDKNPAYNRTIGTMIENFERDYNRKFYKKKRKLDKAKIKHAIHVLAHQNESNNEFIQELEFAETEDLQQFLKWMKAFYGKDYEARLASMHTALANNFYVDSVSLRSNEDNFLIEPGLSQRDKNKVDSIMDYMSNLFDASDKQRNVNKAKFNKESYTPLNINEEANSSTYHSIKNIADQLFKGQKVSNKSLEKVLNDMIGMNDSHASLNDVVYLDGKPLTVKDALIDSLIKATSTAKNPKYTNLLLHKTRPFFNALVSSNKFKKGSSTVQNVEGNNVSMYHKANPVLLKIRKIGNDIASGMSRSKFSSKYNGNKLAMAMFDNKRVVNLSQFMGSNINDDAKLYKDGVKDATFLNDLVFFLKGGNKNYMQSYPISGDSPRRYYSNVPKIVTTKLGEKGKADLYSDIARLAKMNGDERFLSNGRSDGRLVKKAIEEEVKKIKEKISSNKELYQSLQKKLDYKGNTALVDKNGNVTKAGETILESYVTNHLANMSYVRDLFYPTISEFDISKRGKGPISPGTPINSTGKLRVGLIAIKDTEFFSDAVNFYGDEKAGKINATDSMNIILPEDLERIKAIYGGTMVVNNVLKLNNFHDEKENSNFKNEQGKGKGVYLKGLAFTLTDDFVKKNPKYKALREVMRAQRKHYIDNHNNGQELPFNLNDGNKNFFPIAYALSGIKTGLTKAQKEGAVSLDELSDVEGSMAKINALNEYNVVGNKKGYGIDASNLGVQNVMDKEYNASVFASQLQANMYINASVYGTLKDVEGISQIIEDISYESVIKNVLKYLPTDENVTDEDIKKIKDFVLSNTNPELIDPVTSSILKKFNTSLPYIQDRVSQIMKNKIVKEGNKLYTEGGVGLQMSDYGFLDVKDGVLQSNDLKPYGVDEEGKTWIDSKGNSRKATVPAESMIPQYLVDKNDIRLRSKHMSKASAKALALKIASDEASKLHRKDSSKYLDYVAKHSELLVGEDEKGSFVRGESYLGSRIPSHGLQTTLILEAKGTVGTDMGSAIIVPSELSAIMGSDLDGDAIYMNTSGNDTSNIGKKKNKLRLSTIDYMTNEAMQEDMMASLNMEEEKANVIAELEENLGMKVSFDRTKTESFTYPLLPTGQEESFNDNLQTRNLVGVAASMHRFLNMVSAYDTEFDLDLSINGIESVKSFSDKETGIKSRYYKTATLLNVILDNAKEKMAEKIGITPSTASQFILLSGMGYDIKTVATIMNSEGAKAWIKSNENRNNPYFESKGRYDVLESARELAGIKGAPIDEKISLDLKNLDTEDGSRNVIELLNKLDKMQSELSKVNKILSGHKKLETNPFILEKQLREADNLLDGNGIIKYGPGFKNNPVLKKYKRNHQHALDVDSKTNIAYSKTNKVLSENIQKLFGKDFNKKEFAILKNKLLKVSFLRTVMKGYDFNPNTVIDEVFGNEEHASVFDELVAYKNSLSDEEYENNNLLKDGLVIVNQRNDKRISLSPDLLENGNDVAIDKMRENFEALPDDRGSDGSLSLKEKLIAYDFIENGLRGRKSIFPIFDEDNIGYIEMESDNMVKGSDRLMSSDAMNDIQERLVYNMHSMIPRISPKKLKYDSESKTFKASNNFAQIGSDLFNDVIKNEPFLKTLISGSTGNKVILRYEPFTEKDLMNIAIENGITKRVKTINDLPLKVKQGLVNRASFKVHSVVDMSNVSKDGKALRGSPLYKDLNLITFKKNNKGGPDGSPKKKSLKGLNISNTTTTGRSKLKGSEGFTHEMSKDEFKSRNDITNDTPESDKRFREYRNQYADAKIFAEEKLSPTQLKSMSDSELRRHLNRFYSQQAEAVAVATNLLRNELGIRLSQEQSKTTGVTEKGDLTGIEKWFISSNIPSKLPGMQAISKKLIERNKKLLRERNDKYTTIKKATENLYKEKFGSSLMKYNPFKNKDYYKTLYGNLIVEELVGNKQVKNIRLKDRSVIEDEFSKGNISKAEKDFYDTFTSITEEYSQGMKDGDKRRGYIPHTSQSLFESYANRGVLGAFMNSRTNEMKMNDVVLKGYDPIQEEVVVQSYKKFKDSYDAISQNQGLGNKNKLDTKKIFMIGKRAERLAKKGTNEDGTPIRVSEVQIDTLLNGGMMNRFTNSRSGKATLFPSLDLNKALMDYTHSSVFSKHFKDMLPEVDAMITYYKNIGNDNAVKIIETYYKDKMIAGKSAESFLGKQGDNAVKLLNTAVVYKLLAFNTAIVSGNVLAGKYHNIKNNGGKSWVKGEKRFWGLHNLEKSGVQGVFKEFKKSMELLSKLGFMEQNIYEEVSLEKEWNPITKLQNLAFLPMTLSEKWIQGVQFLGQLSDEEWKNWVEKGEMISVENQLDYENKVKASQGRGYNYIDQRLVSLYSLGQSLMMFSRFIPTMISDRFHAEDIDAYGKKHIGSLNQFGKTAQDVISGRMKLQDYKAYKESLPPHKAIALENALRGMSLVLLIGLVGAGAGALGDDETERTANKLVADANYAINLPKFVEKTNLPVISSLKEIINSIFN